jgi:hypothetical protein
LAGGREMSVSGWESPHVESGGGLAGGRALPAGTSMVAANVTAGKGSLESPGMVWKTGVIVKGGTSVVEILEA